MRHVYRSLPAGADPAEFMATARRYAIAKLDKSGIARALYTKPVIGTLIVVGAMLLFALFFASVREQESRQQLAFFDFIPYHWIHNVGLGLMIVVALVAVINLASMDQRNRAPRGRHGQGSVRFRGRVAQYPARGVVCRGHRVAGPEALP